LHVDAHPWIPYQEILVDANARGHQPIKRLDIHTRYPKPSHKRGTLKNGTNTL
jgi:hypothetical protein